MQENINFNLSFKENLIDHKELSDKLEIDLINSFSSFDKLNNNVNNKKINI